MTFVDDNGNQLEFGGSFAMTKQAVSFFNGEVRGDYSINFEVDNNSVNRKVLNYYGPQMTGQVAWTKQAFNRVRNGNILDRGYIVIQNEDIDVLSCFYVSGNSNWVQLLDVLITDLDYTGITNGKNYTQQISGANVVALASENEGIVFPMVDWLCNLNKGNNTYWMVGGQSLLDGINGGLDFYPCFYLHSLINEIVKQNGLKINGTVLDDPLYKSLVISPINGEMKRKDFFSMYLYGSSQAVTTLTKYTSFTDDPTLKYINGDYTAQSDQKIYVKLSRITGGGTTYGYVNGAIYLTFGTGGPGVTPFDTWGIVSLRRGDVFSIYVNGYVGNVRYNLAIKLLEVISVDDFVVPNFFLPKIGSVEILKFVINYFGCSTYFNEYSKTITCNIIEKINTERASDWSEYYIGHLSEYTVNQAKNNYIRLNSNASTDSKIDAYNREHEVGFGEGNIETGNTLQNNNDLINLPLSSSISDFSTNGIFMPNIPLVNLVDGDLLSFTGITDLGNLTSQFTGVSGLTKAFQIFRLSTTDGDLGYFLIASATSTTFNAYYTFSSSFAGTIRIQQIRYQSISPRILSIKPNTSISDFSSGTGLYIRFLGTTEYTTIPFATFTKQITGEPIDQWKNNLAIDNPDSGGFTDPTIKQLYFNKISKFLQNPNIRAKMLLPESVYQSFVFDQFIYLRTENLTGYFFVDSIVNYIDGNTPCEVNLYML